MKTDAADARRVARDSGGRVQQPTTRRHRPRAAAPGGARNRPGVAYIEPTGPVDRRRRGRDTRRPGHRPARPPLDAATTPPAAGSPLRHRHRILAERTDLGGRVQVSYTAINDMPGTGGCNGHGTHVAGTVGGATRSVADEVTRDGAVCSTAGQRLDLGVIAGVDWAPPHGAGPPRCQHEPGRRGVLARPGGNTPPDGAPYPWRRRTQRRNGPHTSAARGHRGQTSTERRRPNGSARSSGRTPRRPNRPPTPPGPEAPRTRRRAPLPGSRARGRPARSRAPQRQGRGRRVPPARPPRAPRRGPRPACWPTG